MPRKGPSTLEGLKQQSDSFFQADRKLKARQKILDMSVEQKKNEPFFKPISEYTAEDVKDIDEIGSIR